MVVLGYANPGDRPNRLNRYRVDLGLRTVALARERGEDVRLVLSGGPVAGPVPEAVLMARHARALGYRGPLTVETASMTTWENVCNVAPLVEDAGRIALVSNALHAERARAYLARQRPGLAERLVPAAPEPTWGLFPLRPALALVGLLDLRGSVGHWAGPVVRGPWASRAAQPLSPATKPARRSMPSASSSREAA